MVMISDGRLSLGLGEMLVVFDVKRRSRVDVLRQMVVSAD